jgi:hypothetical protein
MVPQLNLHRGGIVHGGAGELEANSTHGSGGSVGLGFLEGSTRRRRLLSLGFCPPASSSWLRSLQRRHGAWEVLYRSSAGASRRQAPEAGLGPMRAVWKRAGDATVFHRPCRSAPVASRLERAWGSPRPMFPKVSYPVGRGGCGLRSTKQRCLRGCSSEF